MGVPKRFQSLSLEHGRLAFGTETGLGLGRRRRDGNGLVELEVERGAHEVERGPAGGVMQAEVANLDEVAGQDMLKEAAQELHRRQRGHAGLTIFTPPMPEADGLGVGGKDMAIG